MRTRAAVALEAGEPLQVMDVNLDAPKAGEVLVEIKATGICHTESRDLAMTQKEFFPQSWVMKGPVSYLRLVRE